MSDSAPIKTQAAFWVEPMPPNDVFEVINVDFYAFLKRIEVIQSDQSHGHILLVILGLLVGLVYIRFDFVVCPEETDVRFRVFITHRFVGEKTQ